MKNASAAQFERLLDEGRALHAKGRLAEAFARCQAAYRVSPEDPRVLNLLGVNYMGMGQGAIGLAFLRRAVKNAPQDAELRLNLATALESLGDQQEAAREMGVACDLQPHDADLHATLAALLHRMGRDEAAERHYEAAVGCDPGRAAWHEALARLRYARWDEAGALDSARRALELSADVAERLNIGFAIPRDGGERPPSPSGLLDVSAPLDAQALENACRSRELIVWDDFLPDPMGYRASALRRCEQQASLLPQVNFPGVQTPPQPCEPIMQRIADALGRRLKWESPDHSALRLSLARDDARADVHVDSPTLPHVFAGVLYLSLPEHCRGGTSFYRHRASGWDRRPDAQALRASGFASFLDFQKRHVPANRKQPFAQWQQQRDTTWERLFEVPMRFNRLVVYRADFFHAVTELFGDRPENGRLVQLFHFETES